MRASKAGTLVGDGATLEVDTAERFVSRGGYKLEGALDTFGVDVSKMRCLDVGASTGGFTDCLLQRGARAITAVDVGYGQLAWALRNDPRVTVLERTNVREVAPELLGGPFDLAVIDVSFISVLKVLGAALSVLAEGGIVLALVKPQFEAGKERVGKKGVVRDPRTHEDVLAMTIQGFADSGLSMRGAAWSPIKGPEGNIEFWLMASRGGSAVEVPVRELVESAHMELGGGS